MSSLPKKTGRVPQGNQRRYNVILDEELAEWGKRQSGGLSGLLRRLLKLSRERQGRHPRTTP
ncbi:hypothetical protein LBMAG21_15370 [Armatimonadota bacterium]|nr:hypothetical protein LBMAG21_15370 [Armatimonadota bacterium]